MTIKEAIEKHCDMIPRKVGGKPLLKGTRFSAAQLLAEISENQKPSVICREFDLKLVPVMEFLMDLALALDDYRKPTDRGKIPNEDLGHVLAYAQEMREEYKSRQMRSHNLSPLRRIIWV